MWAKVHHLEEIGAVKLSRLSVVLSKEKRVSVGLALMEINFYICHSEKTDFYFHAGQKRALGIRVKAQYNNIRQWPP